MPATTPARTAYFKWLESFDYTVLEVDAAIALSGRYLVPPGIKQRVVEIIHTADSIPAYAIAVDGTPIACPTPCLSAGYTLFLAYFIANGGIPEDSCVGTRMRHEVTQLEDAISRRSPSPSV